MTMFFDEENARRAEAIAAARRRYVARQSLMALSHLYLANHFRQAPSTMHLEVAGFLERATAQRGARIAVAAPRGHAKSTLVSLAYVLWCVVFGREGYIILVSDTGGQASDLLMHIKTELETNMRLQQDFPAACEPPGIKPAPQRWRQNEIITRNGIRISALGVGSKIRGRRMKQHRPSLIILDDVENEEQASSAERRDKNKRWFSRAVEKAGDEQTNMMVLGTILHYDSLLANLITPKKSPGWTSRKYQAVNAWAKRQDLWERFESIYKEDAEFEGKTGPDAAIAYFEANRIAMLEGTKVLWPERESYLALMIQKLRDGRASFDGEKQNEPVDPDECLFRANDIMYWTNQYKTEEELLRFLGTRAVFAGACDPSLGKPGKGRDDSAIVTLVRDSQTDILYVLDADIGRRTPAETIELILVYHQLRQYNQFGFEINQFQEFMGTELLKRSRELKAGLPVFQINQTTDKLGRIQRLEPLIHTGKLRFSNRHRELLDQLRQFPKGAHDDGLDALEMAVVTARRRKPGLY